MIAGAEKNHKALDAAHPRVWGLSASELHVAFWRARGVQVVERGREKLVQKSAELFLLTEPGQLVWFDIRQATDRMSWQRCHLMRLRVNEEEDDVYHEQIIADASGDVDRVQRVYAATRPETYRVVLTQRSDHAVWWSQSPSRRDAWVRIRRSVQYYKIDHWRCPGRRFSADSPTSEAGYLDYLVEAWTDPDRAIDGVEEIASGIFGPRGLLMPSEALVVGPAWLGHVSGSALGVVIGPQCVPDAVSTYAEPLPRAFVREIQDIELPEAVEDELSDTSSADTAQSFAVAKRLFDIVLSAFVLLVTMPLMAVIGLTIVIDDGCPILYRHRRQGFRGKGFWCWKFRTMNRDADLCRDKLQGVNQCDGPQFYIKNDPRVTRVGRVLRRFHLDEVPQFWNVLIGEMSIVGPRPSPNDENQLCPAWRETRLSVRPGITGLWQVERTRAEGLDFQEWIRFDSEYVERMSLWLDFRILAKTAYRMLWRS